MNLKEKILTILKDACQAEFNNKRISRLIQPATPRVYGLSLAEIVSEYLNDQISIDDVHSTLNELVDDKLVIYHQDTDCYTYHDIKVI